jgi:hypothetical protein
MRSLVVYESWFDNTRRIAEEVAAALAADSEIDLRSVDEPPPLVHVDLLVVGAPTHIHGLSSVRSRKGAIEQRGGDGDPEVGAREWIDRMPVSGVARVAVFDTRADKPELLVGSAAHTMARRLKRRGYRLAAKPESFLVEGTEGPLEEGELERAWEWGRMLANEVLSPTA